MGERGGVEWSGVGSGKKRVGNGNSKNNVATSFFQCMCAQETMSRIIDASTPSPLLFRSGEWGVGSGQWQVSFSLVFSFPTPESFSINAKKSVNESIARRL